jgi:hypothetical protein
MYPAIANHPAMSAVAPTAANEGGIVPNMPERRRSPNR